MWDMTGLEALINVTKIEKEHEQWEKEKMWSILKEENTKPKPPMVPLMMMIMRAKANTQRHYEIYTFDSELSEEDIREAFEVYPQSIVDSIRNIGHKFYSDRADKKQQVII